MNTIKSLPLLTGIFALAIILFPGNSNVRAQNMFVSGYTTGDIYEITPSGTVSTFATGLSQPQGLAFNSADDLFVAEDGSKNMIVEFTPSGTQSTFASGNGLKTPQGLAFNSAGVLFVANYGSSNILEFTSSGTQSTFATVTHQLNGLAFDSSGNLYEADKGNTINEFTPSGSESTFATGLDDPYGLAFNSAGDLFEADAISDKIYEITPSGTKSVFVSTGLNHPDGLAFDGAGDLFEADYNSGNIYEFTNNDGTLSTTATLFASGFGANGPTYIAFAVPEPATWAMLAIGAIAFFSFRRMIHRQKKFRR